MEGYTEIVKLAESALNGDSEKSKFWINKFIEKHPNSELIKPFKALLIGDKNPDKLKCEGEIILDENSNCNKPHVSLCTCSSEEFAEEKPRSDGFWYCKNCGKQF